MIQWLRDKLKFFANAKDSESFLNKNGNSKNVHFLPAFNGLGAPYWNSDIRGGFYGITQDCDNADLTTAAFKSICYQTRDITELLNKNNIKINSLFIDGGMTANKTFCQLLSNILQTNISMPANIESTALGACVVSQIAEGLSIKHIKLELEDIYDPDISSSEFYTKDYLSWKDFIHRTISNIKQ